MPTNCILASLFLNKGKKKDIIYRSVAPTSLSSRGCGEDASTSHRPRRCPSVKMSRTGRDRSTGQNGTGDAYLALLQWLVVRFPLRLINQRWLIIDGQCLVCNALSVRDRASCGLRTASGAEERVHVCFALSQRVSTCAFASVHRELLVLLLHACTFYHTCVSY